LRKYLVVLLAFILVPLANGHSFTSTGLLIPASQTIVLPFKAAVETTLHGKSWAYTVPFRVENAATIEKLIQCESQGVNISRPNSNGLISWGILQFNGTSTWADFSKKSGISGSPLIPSDAIKITDWAISNGYLYRWTCARILHLTPSKTS
jgi:hypothetical protein